MTRLIEDYGMIGDGQTAALVGRDGSIDWLCWPRFDSDACFAALLGTQEHGFWRIASVAARSTKRRYQPDTLVIETEFEDSEGRALVIDFMPIREGAPVLARIVRGLSGRVRMRSELRLRFDYGSARPWIERDGAAMVARIGPDMAVLHADVDWREDGPSVVSEFDLASGDELSFTLHYERSEDAVPMPVDARALLAQTQAWWRDWIGRFERRTDWPDAMRRSLITLKAMIYRPTGGIVAAPTTSLPEAPGGEWNWDYRYCWVRDATLTLSALLNAGFHEEAAAWRDWLLRAVAGDPEKMRIMYRVDGARRLEEWQVPWLPGFRWASPVRIGNSAVSQLQIDVFGELMDALHLSLKAGLPASRQTAHLEEILVQHVEKVWRCPDQGFWESRGKPRHHVYSKVAAWVTVDRYLKIRKDHARDLRDLHALRAAIHADICAEGYDQGLGTFVSYYGAQNIDASLLLLPIVGFLPASDPRIAGTIRAIEKDLLQAGYVRRLRGRDAPAEGAFLACTCWLADCQLRQGRRDDARATFERVLACANDLGLLAEEFDVASGRLAGSFPQALTHLAVVQTGLALSGPVMERGQGASSGSAGDG
jgi:GH15 family glucan-1,4-alpha-glucosidase